MLQLFGHLTYFMIYKNKSNPTDNQGYPDEGINSNRNILEDLENHSEDFEEMLQESGTP